MKVIGLLKPLETINDRVRYLRIVNELSASEMAELLGYSSNYNQGVLGLERGDKKIFLDDIDSYCRIFNVSRDWLLKGEVEDE